MILQKNPRSSFLYYPLATLEGCNYYKEEIKSGICQIIGELRALDIVFLVVCLLMMSIVVSIIRLVFANVGVKSVSLVVQQRR